MGRIGSALALLLVSSAALGAEVEFFQTAEPKELGTDDTLRLSIMASNAPADARVQFPETDDFEVLSRSQSTEMSYALGAGGGSEIKRITKWVLVMRPKRAGNLTIPSSLLVTGGGRNYRADAIKVTVKKGHVSSTPTPRDPYPGFPPPFGRGAPPDQPPVQIPRGDSDLFLRSYVDQDEAYVGEQVTFSVYVFSRVDLSSVDTPNMPKLEGFWTEEFDTPSQLAGEQRVINGVPYRSYLLRRRALFAVKPGTVEIGPVEAELTTGFLFSNRRVRRKSNPLTLTIKPLPASGKPAGFSANNVGQWRVNTEVTETRIALGQPTTVRVILEGQGNLKNVSLPPLVVPSGLRAFDPTTTDRLSSRGEMGGRRVQEYLVMPQQTGSFTLPGLAFPYFDPEEGRYQVSRTDPIEITVEAGAAGATGTQSTASAESPKNVLLAGGLKPLRHQAVFEPQGPALWERSFFFPALIAPPFLFFSVLLGGALRQRLGREDAESSRRRRARAARARLAAAEKLKADGPPDAFYGEVEKALLHFLEAKLEGPIAGLTRDGLDERMAQARIAAEKRAQVLAVLEACDAARYSPAGGESVRSRILDQAEAAMEGWR
ncbi:MAG: BatD family protein [Myxococcota bacterium]|nr:BatD family protein [Myxococcota bacterium]